MTKRPTCARRISTALGLTALVSLLVVPGALGDLYYTDPAGDSGAAPDVTDVSVVNDAAGNITFTVATNQRVLARDAEIAVYVDSDRNPSTGLRVGEIGADHYFTYVGGLGLPLLAHVTGDRLTIDFVSSLTFSYSNGLVARINESDLGDPERFRFVIEAQQEDTDGKTIATDLAPDLGALELSVAGSALGLTLGTPLSASGPPKAGKPLLVTAAVKRSDGEPFVTGKVVCRARIGGATLRASARIANSRASCSIQIPKGAKGKTLRGSLTVSLPQVAPATRAFVFRIG